MSDMRRSVRASFLRPEAPLVAIAANRDRHRTSSLADATSLCLDGHGAWAQRLAVLDQCLRLACIDGCRDTSQPEVVASGEPPLVMYPAIVAFALLGACANVDSLYTLRAPALGWLRPNAQSKSSLFLVCVLEGTGCQTQSMSTKS